jgi:cell division protein FtsQ
VQIGKVKPVIRNGISAIAYRPNKVSPRRLVIYMRDGNTVYADYKTVGKKLAYYPGIAATMKDPGIIDLQVGAYSYSYGSHDK